MQKQLYDHCAIAYTTAMYGTLTFRRIYATVMTGLAGWHRSLINDYLCNFYFMYYNLFLHSNKLSILLDNATTASVKK